MSYFKTHHMRAVHSVIVRVQLIWNWERSCINSKLVSHPSSALREGRCSQCRGSSNAKGWLWLRWWLCVLCVAVYKSVYEMWSGSIQGNLCSPAPPPLLDSSPPSNLRIYILPPAKGRTILAFHFPVQGFPFFADKCSPIHPDRCHIASLPFWYIASDPATCNKEPAPGTPLPRQRSDMGDYFKGASLVMLSAETIAGRSVRIHSLSCPLQECGYRLVSGSGNDNNTTHSVVLTGHPDTVQYFWQRFMPLSTSSQQQPLVPSLTQSLLCDFAGQSWRNNLCKGKVLVLLLPAETHCSVALIIHGQSTSVNTLCQVKVKIRFHSI